MDEIINVRCSLRFRSPNNWFSNPMHQLRASRVLVILTNRLAETSFTIQMRNSFLRIDYSHHSSYRHHNQRENIQCCKIDDIQQFRIEQTAMHYANLFIHSVAVYIGNGSAKNKFWRWIQCWRYPHSGNNNLQKSNWKINYFFWRNGTQINK